MKKEKQFPILDVFLILLLGFLSLTWFRGDNLISGGDFGFPLDWVRFFKSIFISWDETVSLGMHGALPSFLPIALLGAIFQYLGFSLVAIEKILFYIWFAGSGLSMYYLCSVLKMRRLGKLADSLFYMLNPFSLIIIWRVSHGWIQMSYAFAPLFLGVYIQGAEKRKGTRFIILAMLLLFFLTSAAYTNPRSLLMHLIPVFFYFFSAIVFNRKKRIHILKFTSFFLGFLVFINFHWLFPYLSNLKGIFEAAHPPVLLSDIESIKLTSVWFPRAIRMLGYWSVSSGYKGDPYYPYWQHYGGLFINLISWLIPALVLLGFFQKTAREKQLIFFFLGVIIFGLLGMNGPLAPFGRLMTWFYKYVPYTALIARFSFLLYGLPTYLIFSVLLGYGILTVYEVGYKKIGQSIWGLLGILGFLVGVILVWPFWNGEVIQAEGKIFPSERFQVPDYWFEAKDWLTNQKDFFRILPLPMSKTYNAAFHWGEGYSGADMSRWLVPQPLIYLNTGDSFKIPELIGNLIENESDLKGVAKLLGYLNVRYLLLREDTRWDFLQGHGWWFYHQPGNIQNFIKNQDDLRLEKEIGQLKFYRVADRYLLPRIYVPRTATFIDGETASLEDVVQFLKPEEREAFILGKEGDYIWRRPIIPEEDGKSDFTRVVYQLSVDEKGKYEILLRDNFFWQFYQNAKVLGIKVDDGGTEEKNFALGGDNLISLGEVELNGGDHTITIFPPAPVNLVDDPSGGRNFKITAAQDEKIVSFPIKDFKVGETYGISLSAKNVLGNRPFLLFWENYIDSMEPVFNQRLGPFDQGTQKTTFSKLELPADPAWQNYNFTFKPNSYAESIGFSLVSIPNYFGGVSVGKTENWFRDLKVQRVFTNPMVLRRIDGDDRVVVDPPKISFRQRNPVKYEVEIKGASQPFWLVFSEAFHPGWKISVDGDHIVMNGFANGWYIDKTGDYKFDIYFAPQKYLYVGMAVSGLTVVLSMLYLGYQSFSPRRSAFAHLRGGV